MAADRRRDRKPVALTTLELEVMDVVWDLGDCTSAQVIAAFARKRPLAPTTIRTVMSALRRKGYIKPIPNIGRGFLFRPAIPRENVARQSLREMLGSLFHDSPRAAIAYLLEDERVSDEELDEIRRMIDRRRREGERP